MKLPVLKGLERAEKEKEEALSNNHPLLLSLYLDTRCNLKCKFCFLDSGKSHKKQQMSLDEYADLISQAKEMGVKSVLFFGAGEPLMDEKLFPLIEHSNNIGLYAVMFTNASLVTSQIAERMKNLDLSVVVSVKSRNAETLESLTCVKGSAEKIYSGFQNLLYAGLNEGDPTRLGMDILICRHTCDEVPELIRYCISSNIHPMVESLLWKGRAIKNHILLEPTAEQKQKLSERLVGEFPQLSKERTYFEGSACDLDKYSIFVSYNGDVWQCFSRDIVVGNTKHEKLSDIWNKPGLKRLREHSANRSCDMCQGRRYNLEKYLKVMNRRPSRRPD